MRDALVQLSDGLQTGDGFNNTNATMGASDSDLALRSRAEKAVGLRFVVATNEYLMDSIVNNMLVHNYMADRTSWALAAECLLAVCDIIGDNVWLHAQTSPLDFAGYLLDVHAEITADKYADCDAVRCHANLVACLSSHGSVGQSMRDECIDTVQTMLDVAGDARTAKATKKAILRGLSRALASSTENVSDAAECCMVPTVPLNAALIRMVCRHRHLEKFNGVLGTLFRCHVSLCTHEPCLWMQGCSPAVVKSMDVAHSAIAELLLRLVDKDGGGKGKVAKLVMKHAVPFLVGLNFRLRTAASKAVGAVVERVQGLRMPTLAPSAILPQLQPPLVMYFMHSLTCAIEEVRYVPHANGGDTYPTGYTQAINSTVTVMRIWLDGNPIPADSADGVESFVAAAKVWDQWHASEKAPAVAWTVDRLRMSADGGSGTPCVDAGRLCASASAIAAASYAPASPSLLATGPAVYTSTAVVATAPEDDTMPVGTADAVTYEEDVQGDESVDLEIEDEWCHICLNGESVEDNEIVFCDACNAGVHRACYDLKTLPADKWFCDVCAAGETPDETACALCPLNDGVFQRLRRPHEPDSVTVRFGNGSTWVHTTCATWVPETYYKSKMRSWDINQVDPDRFAELLCGVCKVKGGASVQCVYGKCVRAAHPTCVLNPQKGKNPKFFSREEHEGQVCCHIFCSQHKDHMRDPLSMITAGIPRRKPKAAASPTAAKPPPPIRQSLLQKPGQSEKQGTVVQTSKTASHTPSSASAVSGLRTGVEWCAVCLEEEPSEGNEILFCDEV